MFLFNNSSRFSLAAPCVPSTNWKNFTNIISNLISNPTGFLCMSSVSTSGFGMLNNWFEVNTDLRLQSRLSPGILSLYNCILSQSWKWSCRSNVQDKWEWCICLLTLGIAFRFHKNTSEKEVREVEMWQLSGSYKRFILLKDIKHVRYCNYLYFFVQNKKRRVRIWYQWNPKGTRQNKARKEKKKSSSICI